MHNDIRFYLHSQRHANEILTHLRHHRLRNQPRLHVVIRQDRRLHDRLRRRRLSMKRPLRAYKDEVIDQIVINDAITHVLLLRLEELLDVRALLVAQLLLPHVDVGAQQHPAVFIDLQHLAVRVDGPDRLELRSVVGVDHGLHVAQIDLPRRIVDRDDACLERFSRGEAGQVLDAPREREIPDIGLELLNVDEQSLGEGLR